MSKIDKLPKNAEDNKVFTFTVETTLDTTLDLITKRKAFAVIKLPRYEAADILAENLKDRKTFWGKSDNPDDNEPDLVKAESDSIQCSLESEDPDNRSTESNIRVDVNNGCFYEIIPRSVDELESDESCLLFVGKTLPSRDDPSREEAIFRQLSEYSITDTTFVSFPTIGELYELAQDRSLKCQVNARDELESILLWRSAHLGLGEDKGKHYLNTDRSMITFNIQPVKNNASETEVERVQYADLDPFAYSFWKEITSKMNRVANGKDSFAGDYGDDILVECALSHQGEITRCIFTEFFSNHNWSLDPTSLLTLIFKINVLDGYCDTDTVRFAHPTKSTLQFSNDMHFFIQSITTDNEIKPKFSCSNGRGESKKPDMLVPENREWDNLIDFNDWVDVYRGEIDLL